MRNWVKNLGESRYVLLLVSCSLLGGAIGAKITNLLNPIDSIDSLTSVVGYLFGLSTGFMIVVLIRTSDWTSVWHCRWIMRVDSDNWCSIIPSIWCKDDRNVWAAMSELLNSKTKKPLSLPHRRGPRRQRIKSGRPTRKPMRERSPLSRGWQYGFVIRLFFLNNACKSFFNPV